MKKTLISQKPYINMITVWRTVSFIFTFLFCYLFISPSMGSMNIGDYVFSQSTGVYIPITGGTVLGSASNDEEVFNNNTQGQITQSNNIKNTGFPIGFNFFYAGAICDKFAVGTNGYINVGIDSFAISKFNPFWGPENSNHYICPLVMDLAAKNGSVLQYKTIGTAPNRQLIVQWSGYTIKGFANDSINFQIILNEASNEIQFHYGSFTVTSVNTINSQVGLTDVYFKWILRSTSLNWSSTVTGTDQWGEDFCKISSTVFPSNGLIFNFTQPNQPIILDYYPAIGATGILLNSNLTFTFDRPVQKGIGNISIYAGYQLSQTIAVTGSNVTISGNTVTIDPSDFMPDTVIYVAIDDGAFKDMSNINYAGTYKGGAYSIWKFYSGSQSDLVPPSVLTYSPADDASNVSQDALYHLSLNFNEPIKKGTGNIVIKANGNVSQTINVLSDSVSISGNVVSITPLGFIGADAINIEIQAGAFRDIAGNSFSGIADALSWNFVVANDIAAPTADMALSIPADGATNVGRNIPLILRFNEIIKKGIGHILIKENGTILQTIDVTGTNVTLSGNDAIIAHSNFTAGAGLNIEIDQGAFKDMSNNNYAGINNATRWNFTVSTDVTAPTVSQYNPANGASRVASNAELRLTFSEDVQIPNGKAVIKEGGIVKEEVPLSLLQGSSNIVRIAQHSIFSEKAMVSIEIAQGEIKDLAGNSFAGINNSTTWSFTTAPYDQIGPRDQVLEPSYSVSRKASKNVNLYITFDEEVKKGSGNILIKENGKTTQTISVDSSIVSIIDKKKICINPSDFTEGVKVNIEMPSEVFTDLEGNPFAGFVESWIFFTNDFTKPEVITFSPADNAISVFKSSNLNITFSEPVKKGTGFILVKENGIYSQQIDVNSSSVLILGNTATIIPSDFSEGKEVSIEINIGVFKDTADNLYAGIVDATTWNFKVEGTAPSSSIKEENAQQAFSVYPNPASNGEITINSGRLALTSIELINNIGQVLSSIKNPSTVTTIDIESLSTGFYVLSIGQGERVIHRKLQIIRQ